MLLNYYLLKFGNLTSQFVPSYSFSTQLQKDDENSEVSISTTDFSKPVTKEVYRSTVDAYRQKINTLKAELKAVNADAKRIVPRMKKKQITAQERQRIEAGTAIVKERQKELKEVLNKARALRPIKNKNIFIYDDFMDRFDQKYNKDKK